MAHVEDAGFGGTEIVNSTSRFNVDDVLYISPSETTSVVLVSDVLVGTKNLNSWKKSMELALSGRSKLGFVRGEVPKPAISDPLRLARWQRCNDVVMTWLISSVAKGISGGILHSKDAMTAWKTLLKRYSSSHKSRTYSLRKEIYTIMQGDMSVTVYLEKLINLWDELDSLLAEDPEYQMSSKAKEEEHVMSFLMGLGEKHSQIRTQILALRDFPNLDEAYNMVAQDEMQKELTSSLTNGTEASVFYVNNSPGYDDARNRSGNGKGKGSNNNNQNKYKRNLVCSHCGYTGHLKENCYKLIGYPPNYKNNKQNNRNGGSFGGQAMANNIVTGPVEYGANQTSSSSGQIGAQFTSEQMAQLLALITPKTVQNTTLDHGVHMAGPNSTDMPRDW